MIYFVCPENTSYFSNACGCGCEQSQSCPQWINCMPYTYANTIVSDTEPNVGLHLDGTLWWNSGTGLMYVLYNDGSSRVWTQVSGNAVA